MSMNYVIGDIHNDNRRFSQMLEKVGFSEEDHLFLLGDLFDRNSYEPDPMGVYFNVLKLGNRCTVIRGNHDVWLAEYIIDYFNTPEKKRKRLAPYPYNSFAILLEHFTEVDMLNLAKKITEWPLQICVEVDGVKYLLAHACTSPPDIVMPDVFYLMGSCFAGCECGETFLFDGREGYISVCGHANTMENGKIWINKLKNVYMCDCGCGFRDGRLGCLCLETKEEIYV